VILHCTTLTFWRCIADYYHLFIFEVLVVWHQYSRPCLAFCSSSSNRRRVGSGGSCGSGVNPNSSQWRVATPQTPNWEGTAPPQTPPLQSSQYLSPAFNLTPTPVPNERTHSRKWFTAVAVTRSVVTVCVEPTIPYDDNEHRTFDNEHMTAGKTVRPSLVWVRLRKPLNRSSPKGAYVIRSWISTLSKF